MKIITGVIVYNEEDNIIKVIEKFSEGLANLVLIINDGSTDNTLSQIKKATKKNKRARFYIKSHHSNLGVGACIRDVIRYGRKHKFDLCVIMAGNGKDDPSEIPNLIKPIIEENYDYVQGSRFLKGGSYKNLPFVRKLLIKGFTLMMFLFTGFKGTDATNGFRAYKLNIFRNPRINIDQNWLNRYELETYLHYKVITLGYKIREVAVSKDYLPNIKKYSKIRPVIDWWKMFRPLILLKFRIKD